MEHNITFKSGQIWAENRGSMKERGQEEEEEGKRRFAAVAWAPSSTESTGVQKYLPALFDTFLLFHTDARLALLWRRLGEGAFMWRQRSCSFFQCTHTHICAGLLGYRVHRVKMWEKLRSADLCIILGLFFLTSWRSPSSKSNMAWFT